MPLGYKPCPCDRCDGTPVSRATFYRHAANHQDADQGVQVLEVQDPVDILLHEVSWKLRSRQLELFVHACVGVHARMNVSQMCAYVCVCVHASCCVVVCCACCACTCVVASDIHWHTSIYIVINGERYAYIGIHRF
jgi:hypothetical protein